MISKLTLRLLFFNLLLVIFPIAALLFLDTYEKQLLTSLENSMVQQGRLAAAALRDAEDLQEEGVRLLKNMEGRLNARIRIVDSSGQLLADSSSPGIQPPRIEEPPENRSKVSRIASSEYIDALEEEVPENIRENWLYRAAVYPLNIIRRLFSPPAAPLASAEYYSGSSLLLGPEIQAALKGYYGAYTRYSSGGQRSVNLYSALPVLKGNQVAGAVLVSRSTYRTLRDLYSLRLDMVRVFLFSLVAAVVLSLILARTITIPVKKLRDQAESFLDHRGRVQGAFRSLKNRDEIGDLSRALDGLSTDLVEYMRFMDGFSSDLSHELKNPVAAILNAAELGLEEGAGTGDRKRFLEIIRKEGGRIQRLIADLREISQVDMKLPLEEAELLDLTLLTESFVDQRNAALPGRSFRFESACREDVTVRVSGDRLIQCLSNLMDNALSFSLPGEEVVIRLECSGGRAELSVLDRGPGIPAGNGEKIFDRFFSDRPAGSDRREHHSGLGLSISRAIVQAYRGDLVCRNRKGGGACFTITLPCR